jgi:hypothetical protein
LAGQFDDVGGQRRRVIGRRRRSLALRGTILAEHRASPTFGDAEFGDDVLHAGTAAGGLRSFPVPPL